MNERCPHCTRLLYGRTGLCKAHYERRRIHGDPLAGRTPDGAPEAFLREVVLPFNSDDCLFWPFGGIRTYGVIKRNGRSCVVHRVVCEIVYGPPPTPEYEAAHNCGKGRCCNPRHVRWATHAENHADKIEHGTMPYGEKTGRAKITEHDVRLIRASKGKATQLELSTRFGISLRHVGDIQRGTSWAWL